MTLPRSFFQRFASAVRNSADANALKDLFEEFETELEALDDSLAVDAEYLNSLPVSATIGVVAGGTDESAVEVQLLNRNGQPITDNRSIEFYLSDNAFGELVTAETPVLTMTVGGELVQYSTYHLRVNTVGGYFEFVLSDAGTPTLYLVVVFPDGTFQIAEIDDWGQEE